MIQPRKYMRLSQCALAVAAVLLEELQDFFALPLPTVDRLVTDRLGNDARVNLPDALNLLFLLGLIDYSESNDSLHYLSSVDRSPK